MNKLFDSLLSAIGTVLIILAVSIVSTGYLWYLIKPTIEATEKKIINELKGGRK